MADNRMSARRPRRRLRWIVGGGAVIIVAAAIVAAAVFKPWLIFVHTRVDDVVPVAVPSASVTPGGDTPAGPVVISRGALISHEHDTSGMVSVIEKPDGSRVLAIEDLDTTTGPDVHVWLSAAEVIEGLRGWRTAANAPHVDLGQIKGNRGNQVYAIPADVDQSRYPAVFLWCEQLSVSFGAADMRPV